MAYYAALVSLVQLLEDIIHRDRYPDLLLDKQQIAYVYEKFSLLQELLDDYSPKDIEVADFLERRIRDAAYLAQDIIESEISNQIYPSEQTHEIERVLGHLISVFRQHQPQRCEELRLDNMEKEHQDLEKVKEEVDSIVEELMTIKKSHTTKDIETSKPAPSYRNTMVIFEERLTTIKDQLCGEPSKLRVVSIVGMGGIGKTTLAKKIFDDELIVYKFDCRAWVTISQDYHLEKVLQDILDSMNVPTKKSSGVGDLGYIDSMNAPTNKSSVMGDLGEKIYKHLKGMRYLIIIDDMWDTEVWDDVKRFLPDDSNGSRIMITTRISNVAFYVDRFGFYHQMQLLNEDQSWILFREQVFCPLELEDLGKLIAKNCRGLPLAIVVVAGLLAKVNKKRHDWEEIAGNISSSAAENDEHFSKVLTLSYNHLPHHLKPCFLYIGGFPKDYEIRVSELIKLWIAEGFIKAIEFKSLEAVAEEYLEGLVNRNLILITKKRSNGKIKCCGIHDLLRDLCSKIISYENFLHILDYNFHPTAARNIQRLFIRNYFPYQSWCTKAKEFSSHIRSIISHTDENWEFLFFGSSWKLLRVLDAKGHHLGYGGILKLFNLRYLAFSIYEIPSSIVLLRNLQTLIVEEGDHVKFGRSMCCPLPSQIQEMPNLRHIMSSKNIHFECQFFSKRIVGEPSILKNLQTLSWVKDVRFTKQVIKILPNLQKLKVLFDEEKSLIWQKFCLDKLFHLRQLETLYIYFRNKQRSKVNPLPRSFAFPLTLKNLSLIGCRIPWKDMTVVGSLPNLQVLKLRDYAFVGVKWETVEGEFPKLKFLLMEGLGIKYWEAENTHFPALQHLQISYCRKLQEIPPEIGEISTLQLVEVNSSKLAAKSAMKMQEEQRDQGNDILQVHLHRYSLEEELQEEDSGSDDEIQEEPSESDNEIQEEGSESDEEEALESEDEIQQEDSFESNEEIQEINPVN